MFDPDVIEKLDTLRELYKYRWEKDVDYTILPSGMTQEDLVIVLERIVDTGESILVGYDKCFLSKRKM